MALDKNDTIEEFWGFEKAVMATEFWGEPDDMDRVLVDACIQAESHMHDPLVQECHQKAVSQKQEKDRAMRTFAGRGNDVENFYRDSLRTTIIAFSKCVVRVRSETQIQTSPILQASFQLNLSN